MRRLRHLRPPARVSAGCSIRRAEEREVPVDDVLTTEVAAAMVLVLGSDTHPQTVRLGRRWVKDERGKKAVFPPEHLDVWSYRAGSRSAVVAHGAAGPSSTGRTCSRSVKGVPIEERDGPAQVDPLPEGLGGDEFDLEDAQADDPLDLLVERVRPRRALPAPLG